LAGWRKGNDASEETTAARYRSLAQDCLDVATTFPDRDHQRDALLEMAQVWQRLADQYANATSWFVFQPGAGEQSVVQQQKQVQKDEDGQYSALVPRMILRSMPLRAAGSHLQNRARRDAYRRHAICSLPGGDFGLPNCQEAPLQRCAAGAASDRAWYNSHVPSETTHADS